MALREFSDDQGLRWRAWDILPGQLHPSTRSEDYMQGFEDGWIAFESEDGSQRARLSPVPRGWEQGTEEELRALLAHAERPRKRGGASAGADAGTAALTTAGAAPDEAGRDADGGDDAWSGESWPRLQALAGAARGHSAPPGTMRTIRYPGGRYWSIYEQPLAERVVLRFSSGARSLDLVAWPARWFERSDDELVELLRRAFPRSYSEPSAGAPARRHGDRPTAR